MKAELVKTYKEFRQAGYRAEHAKYATDALIAFEDREDLRIVAYPEEGSYFDVYGEPDTEKEKEQILHYLELWGCWCVASEKQCPECGEWEIVDCVGWCCYADPTDPLDNLYVPDLMHSALNQ
ncbi:MAG: hypothetical protein GY841_16245 [FCB group bacterium]|nr:hypothetical protein [FCB group bacterium]